MKSIRVVTLNLWNDSVEAERRMVVLVKGLIALEPELVGLQEVRQADGAGARQAERIARALGADFRFAVVDPTSQGGPIGNAVISRLPITGSRTLALPGPPGDPRNALRCEIATPGGRMPFITTHLSWELDAAPVRERQAVAVDEFARTDPGDLPAVLTGDFNCTPGSLAHQFLTGRASLFGRGTYWRDAYLRRHPHSDGYTWAARNQFVARAVERDRRIDYVFVGPMREGGPGAILHARVVLDLASGEQCYPSDHFGVFAEIACEPVPDGI